MTKMFFILASALIASGANATDLADGAIAQIVQTVDQGELAAAQLAETKAKKNEVRGFAKMMIREHKANEVKLAALEKKNKITPEDSEMSKSLDGDANKANEEIKAAEGPAFDKAYIAEQVKMHEDALKALKETLIPAATNPKLKAFLEKTAVSVNEHLEHAQKIQSKLD